MSVAEDDDVQYLPQGTPTPQDGFLFPPTKALDARKAYLERDELRLKTESLQKSLDFELNNEKSNEDKIREFNSRREILEILWFGIGVAAAGFTFYVVKTTAK